MLCSLSRNAVGDGEADSLPAAEQEGMAHLFARAIAVYKTLSQGPSWGTPVSRLSTGQIKSSLLFAFQGHRNRFAQHARTSNAPDLSAERYPERKQACFPDGEPHPIEAIAREFQALKTLHWYGSRFEKLSCADCTSWWPSAALGRRASTCAF